MSATDDRVDYQQKQSALDSDYSRPFHWELGHAEARRYRRVTGFVARNLLEAATRYKLGEVTLVDVGCGDGLGTYLLSRQLTAAGLDVETVGVDVSGNAIRWARSQTQALAGKPIHFQAGSASDAVQSARSPQRPRFFTLREVIEHLPEADVDNTLSQLGSLLNGGAVLVTVPSTNSPVGKYHLRHYTAETLASTFARNGLRVDRLEGFEFRPRPLYGLLHSLKDNLDGIPAAWRILSPLWRPVRSAWATTLLAVGTPLRG